MQGMRHRGAEADGGGAPSWADGEVAGCDLGDRRLVERLRTLLRQLGAAVGQPLPLACQDWAGTKAAYRFFASPRFGEDAVLAGHFAATAARCAASGAAPLLVVQDTTELVYKWAKPGGQVGLLKRAPIWRRGPEGGGKARPLTQCGLLMHSSLVVTPEGLPLGLAAAKFWTRSRFKGTNALKRHVNPTRVPIEQKESMRWLSGLRAATALIGSPDRLVHIGDRENDIYEFFCAAAELGTHFLVRTCVDRLAVAAGGRGGRTTVGAVMAAVPPAGEHAVGVGAADGTVATARLELRFARVHVLPPWGKQTRWPPLDLTIIHAVEPGRPEGRDRVEWKLATDLPVRSADEAVEKLRWYARRWNIELFHKVLKSGCRVEAARLRAADRLAKLAAVLSVVAWRIFWSAAVARAAPAAPARVALTADEVAALDAAVPDKPRPGAPARHGGGPAKTLGVYLRKVARLGGHLGRNRDPPPGNTVMWRGWSRLADITLGQVLARRCR
jgi:hypothetical protein